MFSLLDKHRRPQGHSLPVRAVVAYAYCCPFRGFRLEIRVKTWLGGWGLDRELVFAHHFNRFLAGHVKLPSKMGEEPSTLVYGCALAPPLWLCVQRHLEIQQFRTEPYWTLMVTVTSSKDDVLELEWGREKVCIW